MSSIYTQGNPPKFQRLSLSTIILLFSITASATCGGVDYSQGAGSLATMTEYVTNMMGYAVMIIYSFASILSIISALQIYVKMNEGTVDFKKEIIRLVGAIMMLIGSTAVLPAFFGFHVF